MVAGAARVGVLGRRWRRAERLHRRAGPGTAGRTTAAGRAYARRRAALHVLPEGVP